MNRRALFKSIVASVCIGTAQQLGLAKTTPGLQRGYLSQEELDRIYKRMTEAAPREFRGFYHIIDHLPPPRYNYSKTNPEYRDA